MKKHLEEILKQNEVLLEIKKMLEDNDFCDSFYLVGGAVIDILEGRTPKDYDLITDNSIERVIRDSFKVKELTLLYTSRTAVTFLFNQKHIIQVLKRETNNFKFTIEKTEFSIKGQKLDKLCNHSFKRKILIPNDEPFEDKEVTKKEFKIRVNKWKSKGYTIHKKTYASYLKWARSTSLLETIKEYFKPKSINEYES